MTTVTFWRNPEWVVISKSDFQMLGDYMPKRTYVDVEIQAPW